MIDITTQVVARLNTVLPCVYELFLDKSAPIPCISYQQTTNLEEATGNTLGWSLISFRIKIWATSVEELTEYAIQIDDAMAVLGEFTRTQTADLTLNNNLLCRLMDYQILVHENYNTIRS